MDALKRVSLPLVIIIALIIIILLIFNIQDSFDPPFLQSILNTLIYGILLIIVAFFAAKVYVKVYTTNYLYMFCALLIMALGAILAGWLRYLPNGRNVNTTIYNSSFLVGSVFNLLAALWKGKPEKLSSLIKSARTKLIFAMLGILLFAVLLVSSVLLKVMPLFVDQNGFTMLRQIIMGASIVFFFSASMVMINNYQKLKSDFLYWYSFSLIMIIICIFGAMLATVPGGYCGWLIRFSGYLGCFFALFSILSAMKEAKITGTTFVGIMEDFFTVAPAIYKRVVETSNDAICSIDQDFRVLYMNPAAEKLFGIPYLKVMNISFIEYIQDCDKALLQDDFKTFITTGISTLAGKIVEIEAKDSNGRIFPVEISTSMRVLSAGCVGTYIIRDITQRKRSDVIEKMKNSLEEAQRIAHIASWEWDIRNNTVQCSDNVYNVMGLDPNTELVKGMTYGYTSPEDRKKIEEAHVAALKTGLYEVEYPINTPDGRTVYLYSQGKVCYDVEGKPVSMTGYMQDITERKLAEEKAKQNESLRMETAILRQKEEEYLQILDSSTEGTWIIDCKNGTMMYSNQWLARIGAENIPSQDVLDYAYNLTHPEDKDRIFEERKVALDKKLPKYKLEYRIKTVDNEYIWVLAQGKVIYDEDGVPVKIYGTSMDITDRNKMEQQLLRQAEELMKKEEELLEVLDTVSEGSWVRNIKEGTVKYSKKWMRRVEKNTDSEKIEIKDNVFMMLHPEDADKFLQAYNKSVLNRERRFSYECRAKNADGSYSWTLFRTKVNFDNGGTPLMLYGAGIDINSMKNMELELKNTMEELKIADNNKNEFLSVLSHELRNPLATIVAGLSLLDLSDDIQQKREVQDILQRQIDQLCSLVDDLLDLTRITRNKIILKKERVDLNKLALSILADQKLLFNEKDIFLEAEINEDELCLELDPVRIKQIIGNLLHNAMKFTEPRGNVKLSVYQENNEAVIHVEDNGSGIKPEFLPYLFEPFKQSDNSLDRHNGGLGLGLSIVKGIAELHGGRVTASSNGLGKGTKIMIYLPLLTENSKKDVG